MAMSKRKKKNMVWLIVLIIICAALIAALVILTKKNAEEEAAEEETTTAAEAESLFSSDNSDLVEISYTHEDQSMTFKRDTTDSDWYSTEDEDYPIDQSSITSLASYICAMTVQEVFADSLDTKSDYSLDDPEYVLTVKSSDGTQKTIYYGPTTMKSSTYRYAYIEGDNRILSLPVSPITNMVFDITEIASYDTFPEVDSSTITHITYSDENQSIELFNDPSDLTLADAIGTTVWYYKLYDNRYTPCNYDEIDEFLTEITGITYTGLATADAEDLSEYGLDEPKATLSFSYDVTTEVTSDSTEDSTDETTEATTVTTTYDVTVYMGNLTEDGTSAYIMLKGDNAVYTVSADTETYFTDKILTDYLMSKLFAMCNFDGIESIDVTYGDKTLNIEVIQGTGTDDDGEEVTTYDCYINGESADESDTRKLFANIIRPSADHILADGEEKEGEEPIFTVTYHTNYTDVPEITYEISNYDSVYYQVSVNGHTKYAMTKQAFNTLIENVESYLK